MSRTVQAALSQGRAVLEQAQIPNPDLDARWLLAAAIGVAPDRVILHLRDPLDDVADAKFLDQIAARATGRPISHILGRRQFLRRWFEVTPDVLDPRPETETLVELALAQPFETVLDLGTGSGCILLSLLAERAGASGLGTDLSQAALAVAGRNADALGLADRVRFKVADWWAEVEGAFDLVVSNPPYISAEAYNALMPDVRNFEPKLALTPGGDGLAAYRLICTDARKHLRPNGRLLVEIGYDQGTAVSSLFHAAGLEDVTLHSDLDGKDRVVSGRCPKATLP